MTIKKTDAGWLVDVQPGGRGAKRVRKTLKTLAEAKAYDAWLKTQANQDNAWMPARRDLRRLSDLIAAWYQHHGSSLRSGDDMRRRLAAMATAMRDPVADKFSVQTFAAYRDERLKAGISAANMNREHAYLRSVFSELKRLGQWKGDNPMSSLRQFKIVERELTYLDNPQIIRLLHELGEGRNKHAKLIAKICLATGARWSEAESLTIHQVKNGLIQYARTKSGKTRAVPVNQALFDEIHEHYRNHGADGHIFESAASAFRKAIDRANIALPDGQLTHVLRHTFASHFMINGGNILTLQRILGHASLTMTMRYAHLSPDHLEEARRFNPLSQMRTEPDSRFTDVSA
ncbi:tyrosine-type recombinase/integrase [Burkholderia multivorans]|uniref:phage integrase n=1 Tax=Burkholderia multivorans TaxID=87883 RepID=UPI0012DF503E|nr:tyrosine-type recombinase/integrase [Burkholderia multivorans]QGR87741.1 tyrosine-type recombinase/integrase [Burkholderia multivorans]